MTTERFVDIPAGGLSLQQHAAKNDGTLLIQENAGAAERAGYNAQLAAYCHHRRCACIEVYVRLTAADVYSVDSRSRFAQGYVLGGIQGVRTWMEALALTRAAIARLEAIADKLEAFMAEVTQ